MKYIVQLEKGIWVAEWEGDPGRTHNKKSAAEFISKSDAEFALRKAREYRDYKDATVIEVNE